MKLNDIGTQQNLNNEDMCTLSAHKCTLSMSTFFNGSNPLTYSYTFWFLGSKTTEDESTKACVSVQENENGKIKKIS